MYSTKQDSIEVVKYIQGNKGNWRYKKPQVSHDKTRYRYTAKNAQPILA